MTRVIGWSRVLYLEHNLKNAWYFSRIPCVLFFSVIRQAGFEEYHRYQLVWFYLKHAKKIKLTSFYKHTGAHSASCRTRFDSQTTGMTWTAGVRLSCTNRRSAKSWILVMMSPVYWLQGPSLMFYPRPIEEWFSLLHNEIGQSLPSFSGI